MSTRKRARESESSGSDSSESEEEEEEEEEEDDDEEETEEDDSDSDPAEMEEPSIRIINSRGKYNLDRETLTKIKKMFSSITRSSSSPPRRKREKPTIVTVEVCDPPFTPSCIDEFLQLEAEQTRRQQQFRDCSKLSLLRPHLEALRDLVGMGEVKKDVCSMILSQMQAGIPGQSLRHTIIYGPPGVGKTTLVNILANIMSCFGTLKTPKVVHANAASMIAGFLGQTTSKTEELIQSARGGVLLIDEASSISDGRTTQSGDSFSKSAIDTLNRHLTENGSDFVCILAGYEKEIHRDFLSVNPGLERRFTTIFRIQEYSSEELWQMAIVKLKATKLNFNESDVDKSFFTDKKFFKGMGGDIQTFVDKILVQHSVAVFGKSDKFTLSKTTIKTAFEAYVSMKKEHPSLKDTSDPPPGMYI